MNRTEAITVEIHDELADSRTARFFGRNALSEHAQARRIVWVPTVFSTQPPRESGRDFLDGDVAHGIPRQTVVMCADRAQTIEAHIFAPTEVEKLLDATIAAIHRVLLPWRLDGAVQGKWVSEERDTAGKTLRTDKVVLAFRVLLDVPEETRLIATVKDTATTYGDGDDAGTVTSIPE